MSPSKSSMPLIAFLLFTHARLQDNACAMSHDSYVGSRKSTRKPLKSRNQQRNPEISRETRKSVGNQEISDSTGNHW